MGILNQCVSILDLVSLDWDAGRFSTVAHSFRVMSKARNYEECIVGVMHEVYGGSYYARSLFSCDVDEASMFKPSLELFVPPLKSFKAKTSEEIPKDQLLACNCPQGLTEAEREEWIEGETRWSTGYRKWLDRFKSDELARNVLCYDLEDKLEVLLNPKIYEDEYGPQYFVLPWKRHYCIRIRRRSCNEVIPIPEEDDALLLRPLKEIERFNLIEKYSHGLNYLKGFGGTTSHLANYTPEEQEENRIRCMQWLNEWVENARYLEEMYPDYEEDEPETDL